MPVMTVDYTSTSMSASIITTLKEIAYNKIRDQKIVFSDGFIQNTGGIIKFEFTSVDSRISKESFILANDFYYIIDLNFSKTDILSISEALSTTFLSSFNYTAKTDLQHMIGYIISDEANTDSDSVPVTDNKLKTYLEAFVAKVYAKMNATYITENASTYWIQSQHNYRYDCKFSAFASPPKLYEDDTAANMLKTITVPATATALSYKTSGYYYHTTSHTTSTQLVQQANTPYDTDKWINSRLNHIFMSKLSIYKYMGFVNPVIDPYSFEMLLYKLKNNNTDVSYGTYAIPFDQGEENNTPVIKTVPIIDHPFNNKPTNGLTSKDIISDLTLLRNTDWAKITGSSMRKYTTIRLTKFKNQVFISDAISAIIKKINNTYSVDVNSEMSTLLTYIASLSLDQINENTEDTDHNTSIISYGLTDVINHNTPDATIMKSVPNLILVKSMINSLRPINDYVSVYTPNDYTNCDLNTSNTFAIPLDSDPQSAALAKGTDHLTKFENIIKNTFAKYGSGAHILNNTINSDNIGDYYFAYEEGIVKGITYKGEIIIEMKWHGPYNQFHYTNKEEQYPNKFITTKKNVLRKIKLIGIKTLATPLFYLHYNIINKYFIGKLGITYGILVYGKISKSGSPVYKGMMFEDSGTCVNIDLKDNKDIAQESNETTSVLKIPGGTKITGVQSNTMKVPNKNKIAATNSNPAVGSTAKQIYSILNKASNRVNTLGVANSPIQILNNDHMSIKATNRFCVYFNPTIQHYVIADNIHLTETIINRSEYNKATQWLATKNTPGAVLTNTAYVSSDGIFFMDNITPGAVSINNIITKKKIPRII